ncbi:biliverdin-producing heme oxygenase [Streptomyces sp. DG2A-72]|uniref:biliverdin-producing heme oxygenase n=1 Tax=Streptomyces sp. DG2A-72 TaxID=3051386 RepID=UPI00265B7753|nr:biliverdin-producing heme oxygenase [Streptomyces sp. DG2A-72]MDO0932949.1 biliverdin-producing heme oxygenase [Streptomyces sp. DG2A-72]
MTATPAERLRAATRAWHDALETTTFATAMASGTLPLDRYVGQLAAYREALAALEGELSRATSPSLTHVWSPDLAKLPLLERDLRYFTQSGIDPPPQARVAGRAFAEEIRRTAAADPEALLGFLYVMECSTLGALLLHRYVSEAYRLTVPYGLAYYGSGDRTRWAGFTTRLNEALTGPDTEARVLAAAERAYHHTASVAQALAPPARATARTPPGS